MPNYCKYTVATHNCVSPHAQHCVSAINLISELRISYQQLIKTLLYAQAFVLKTFHIFFHVSTSFLWNYNRNSVDIKEMPTSKILQGRCVKARGFISRQKHVFLVGFSLLFPRFPRISKNQLNTSLLQWLLLTVLPRYSKVSGGACSRIHVLLILIKNVHQTLHK